MALSLPLEFALAPSALAIQDIVGLFLTCVSVLFAAQTSLKMTILGKGTVLITFL